MDIDIAKEGGVKASERDAYNKLGNSYYSLEQYTKALEYHYKHLDITREIEDRAGEGEACSNIGKSYASLGQYEKAIEYYDMHLIIARKIEDKTGAMNIYQNLGDCYHSLKDYNKALEHYNKLLQITKDIEDWASEGSAYGDIGTCYMSMDQYDKASFNQTMQLDIARKLGDKRSQGMAHGNLGDSYESMGQYEKALEHHTMNLDITIERGDKEGERQAYHRLGRTYLAFENYDKAEHYCRKSLQCFDEVFEAMPDKLKNSMRNIYIETNQVLNVSLLHQDKTDEALVISEKVRSLALDDRMIIRPLIQNSGDAMAPLYDLTEIREVVKTLDSTVLFFAMTGSVINTWILQTNGDITFKRTHVEVPSKKPEEKVSSSRLGDVCDLIRTATNLLRGGPNVKCEDRSLSFLYPERDEPRRRPNAMFPYALMHPIKPPQPPDPEEELAKAKFIDKWEFKDLQKLYQMVLEPARQSVKGSRVVVVPDETLPLIPFSALVDENKRYVAESLQMRLIPSLATAKMISENTQEPDEPPARPLVVGDPDVPQFQGDGGIRMASNLRHVTAQVDKVSQLLKVPPLTGKKATKETVLKKLHGAKLVHIAAHGDLAKGEIYLAPGLSIPKRKIRKEDITLTISDIKRKRLSAKLVVLICRQIGRHEAKPEGVIRIARAFLVAGARAVLVNISTIKNETTVHFMEKFYENLLGGDMASDALDKTMEVMRATEEFAHPYLWAPFVLIGEDVAPFAAK